MKTRNLSLSLLLISSLFGCQGPTPASTPKEDQSTADAAQKIELEVDGTKKATDPTAVLQPSYTSAHFMLAYLSDKEDIQLTLSAYMPVLQPGTYQVYECKAGGECNDQVPDNNQTALYGPYPKDPMPAMNLFRTAYYAPKLGLTPLTLVINSVKDEQQAGNPYKTKRVEGQFTGGNMAHVEQQAGGYDWHVVGKTTQIKGSFSVLCSMR